jgi:hypothetical protein
LQRTSNVVMFHALQNFDRSVWHQCLHTRGLREGFSLPLNGSSMLELSNANTKKQLEANINNLFAMVSTAWVKFCIALSDIPVHHTLWWWPRWKGSSWGPLWGWQQRKGLCWGPWWEWAIGARAFHEALCGNGLYEQGGWFIGIMVFLEALCGDRLYEQGLPWGPFWGWVLWTRVFLGALCGNGLQEQGPSLRPLLGMGYRSEGPILRPFVGMGYRSEGPILRPLLGMGYRSEGPILRPFVGMGSKVQGFSWGPLWGCKGKRGLSWIWGTHGEAE